MSAHPLAYRHWLEVRGGGLVATAVTVLLCMIFPLAAWYIVAEYPDGGSIWQSVASDVTAARRATMGPEQLAGWAVHANLCLAAAVSIGLFIGGTGIRTNSLMPNHPSIYFTLSLPVSRTSLAVGRFAAGYVVVLALFGGMLVCDTLALLALGASPPFAPMAAASVQAALLCIAIVGVLGAVQLVNEVAAGWAYSLALLAFVLGIPFGWQAAFAYVAGAADSALPAAAAGGVGIAALALSVVIAGRRDF